MDIKSLAAGIGTYATPPATRPVPAREGSRVAEREPSAAGSANDAARAAPGVERALSISVDKETGKTVVRVLDPATGEVIRQVPAEEQVALARALEKLNGHRLETKA
ncbi:MAG: flagellar protein FlaG [Betaproteobacteria bacterium]|nr:flagellar protein FlaG [Betaproteobacteria bacterium]